MAAIAPRPIDLPIETVFTERNPATGTEISVRYVDVKDKKCEGFLRITNGNFQREYPSVIISHPNDERVREVSMRILQLDLNALKKFPEELQSPWPLNEEIFIAALLSEDPEMRAKGAQWLSQERHLRVEFEHKERLSYINTYFDGLEQWKNTPFPTAEQLKIDQEFFDVLQSRNQKAAEQFIDQFGDASIIILRALWFKDHPFHKQCKEVIEEISFDKRYMETGKFGPLGEFIHAMSLYGQIPKYILDKLELPPRKKIFPQELTKEQALHCEHARYEEITCSEERPMPFLPPLSESTSQFSGTNPETGTSLYLEWVFDRNSAEGSVSITNGSIERRYARILIPGSSEEKIYEIADRILGLDQSSVKLLPKALSWNLQKEVAFAAFLSENSDVRTRGIEAFLEERRRMIILSHQVREKKIHEYFDALQWWQIQPFPDSQTLQKEKEFLSSLELPGKKESESSHKIDQLMGLKDVLANALWFQEHPYHERCKTILQEWYNQIPRDVLAEKYGPLANWISSLEWEIPSCVIDALHLPGRKRRFPETREEALQAEQVRFERALRALEVQS